MTYFLMGADMGMAPAPIVSAEFLLLFVVGRSSRA
jgi:hypothetical protein